MSNYRQEIDLYIPELRPKIDYLAPKYIAAAAVLMVIAVVVSSVILQAGNRQLSTELTEINTSKDSQEVQLQVLRQSTNSQNADALESQVESLKEQLAARREVYRLIADESTGNRKGFSGQLQALAKHGSSQLSVESFLVFDRGHQVRMTGGATSAAAVPIYLEKLRAEPVFNRTIFGSLSIQQETSEALVRFRMNVDEKEPSS